MNYKVADPMADLILSGDNTAKGRYAKDIFSENG